MEKTKCPNKAQYVAPWGGKLMFGCATHISDLVTLGKVMGSPTEVKAIMTHEPCYGFDDFKEREEAQKEKNELD